MKKKTKEKLYGIILGLAAISMIWNPVVAEAAETVQAEQEAQETVFASSRAKENTPGELTGWGKAYHPYSVYLTMKKLPENGSSTVKIVGQKNRAVTIGREDCLKLYGLYKNKKGDIYRHVGVTYGGVEYYGYILEERITACEAPVVLTPTPTPTLFPTPVPTTADYSFSWSGWPNWSIIFPWWPAPTPLEARIKEAVDGYNTGLNDIEIYCQVLKTKDFASAISHKQVPGKSMTYGQYLGAQDTLSAILEHINYNLK